MNVIVGSIAASAGIVLVACLYAIASEDSMPDTVHHYKGSPKPVVVATVQSQEAVSAAPKSAIAPWPTATYTDEERARLVEIQRQHTVDALGQPTPESQQAVSGGCDTACRDYQDWKGRQYEEQQRTQRAQYEHDQQIYDYIDEQVGRSTP